MSSNKTTATSVAIWTFVGASLAAVGCFFLFSGGSLSEKSSDSADSPAQAVEGSNVGEVAASGETVSEANLNEGTSLSGFAGNERFASAETVAEDFVVDRSGMVVERRRLVPAPNGSGRLLRVVDRVDPADRTRILRQSVMWADSIVVGVPREKSVSAVVAKVREAGYAVRPAHERDAVIDVVLPNPDLESLPAALNDLSIVLAGLLVEPNFLSFPSKVFPNDYDANEMWALNFIEAPAAWAISQGSAEVVVAVIDTGIDWDHPDLAANMWINPGEIADNGVDDDANGFVDDIVGWNFLENDANPNDSEDHGSHVAGTIGAVGDNDAGVVGVNWEVRLIALRAGDFGFDTADTINAIRYVNGLREAGVNVVAVNASFGGGGFSQNAFNELQALENNDVLFIAAAGNDGLDNDNAGVYPASYEVDTIISVASIAQSGDLSSFSNFGAASVDIAAPGTGIRSTVPGGLFDYNSGTSMATPHVAGAAALLAASDPTLSALEIRARILQSAEPSAVLAGSVATGGHLNLRRLLAPGIVPPRVAITMPNADVVVIEESGLDLGLGASLLPEDGVTPTASFSWETVEGPASVVFSDPALASPMASFPTGGVYRLRVNASSGGIVESDDITVFVGNGNATIAGLRGWWRFDENSGNALDASGNGRTGVITGAEHVPGVLSGGLDFNGSSTSVSFDAPSLPQMTITAWARADSAGNSIFPRIVNMQPGLFFFGLAGDTRDGNGDTLKFAVDDGLENRVWHTAPGTIVTNRLYQVAVTYDSSLPDNNPRFFIDGVPYGVGVQTGGGGGPVAPAVTGFIGDKGDGSRHWDGLLDEVRIYDRELSAAELAIISRENTIQALMSGENDVSNVLNPLGAIVSFSPAQVEVSGLGAPDYEWSPNSEGLAVGESVGNSVEVRVNEPGTYNLRLDIEVAGRLHVVRSIPISVNPPLVETEGYYSGTANDGAAFVVLVDENGSGTFVGGGSDRGRIGLDLDVSPYGFFEFEDGDGDPAIGVIQSGGTIAGLIDNTLNFSGALQPTPGGGGADPTLDGVYRGWIVDSGTRVSAVVAEGRIAAVVELSGDIAVADGNLDGSGDFSVAAGEAIYIGSVEDGRINGTVAVGTEAARSFVLLRSDFLSTRGLASLSVRGPIGQGADIMIAGFALEGAGEAPLLVRGVGPALEDFGVTDAIQAPHLTVLSGNTVLEDNLGWDLSGVGEAAAIAAAASRTGAFALAPGAPDAALLSVRAKGVYTMHVSNAEGGTGTGLAEVYDASEVGGGPRLVAVSSRSPVGSNGNIPIAGFSLSGNAPSLVLVRAVGPGLEPFGVTGTLDQPTVSVVRDGENIASGAAWEQGESLGVLTSLSESVGAFDLEAGSADASILLFLPPGLYTAQVNGVGGTQGIVLLEVYLVESE